MPRLFLCRRTSDTLHDLLSIRPDDGAYSLPALHCLCVSPIYSALRQLGICRPILEVGGSPEDLQYSGCYQRVDRDTIHFAYPSLSKGLLMVGSMVRFPVHNGYFGKPAHHTGVSTLSWLLISKLLNPQPAAPGQDALGLITLYPRPDEHGISAAAHGQRRPQPFYPAPFPSSEPLINVEPIRSLNNYFSPYSCYHRRNRDKVQ